MRGFLAFLVIIGLAGGGVWFFFFKKEAPAQTPDEAFTKYKNALKKRDYETAAMFVTADYAELLRKVAKAAKEVGERIDKLREQMEKHGMTSKKADEQLNSLEPFPITFDVLDIQKKGDDEATAKIGEKGKWEVKVKLKREGANDDKAWKIDFPVNAAFRSRVELWNKKYKDYVLALKAIIEDVQRDPTVRTRSEFETRLKKHLDDAGKE